MYILFIIQIYSFTAPPKHHLITMIAMAKQIPTFSNFMYHLCKEN